MSSMNKRSGRRSLLAALPLALLAGLIAVAPAAADTAVSHSGENGPHSLRDTKSGPGVACIYGPRRASDSVMPLKRLEVRPPKVKGSANSATVGWRFIVQRTHQVSPEWLVTYKSPTQIAPASATNASFTGMGIKVNLPNFPVYYRVLVKMFWYDANGSKLGQATHRVNFYDGQTEDGPWAQRNKCTDGLSFSNDR